MYYVSAMRSDALVHAPSSPVKRIHLVGRRTGQHLGDAPIVHTIAPPALLAAHPVLPHCGSTPVPLAQPITNSTLRQAQGYSAAQCPSPPLRPACYATRLRHRAPLRGMQGGVSAAIFALAPHLLAPPQKGRTPADANRESSRSLASLGAAAFASASGWHLFPAPLLVPSRLRAFIILPPAPQWGKGGCAGTVSTDHSAGQEVHTYEVDLMLETTACGNDDIPMARVPSGCIEVVEQCFVKLPRDSSVIRPYQTSTRRRQQETVWWVKSVARAVDAHNGLKEHWWRSVWRGDRERALDGRMSWWKPRNVTLITSESSASEICAPNLPAILKRQKSSKPLAKPVESQITVRTRRKRCKQLPLGDIRHLRAYTRLLDHKSVASAGRGRDSEEPKRPQLIQFYSFNRFLLVLKACQGTKSAKNYCTTEAGSIHKCVGIGVSGRKQTSAQGRRSSTQAAGIEREGGGERAAGGGGGGGGGWEPNGAGERAANGAGTERGGRERTAQGARAANGASERRGGRTANGAGRVQRARARGRAANGAEARAASTSAGAGGERRGRAGSEWRQRTARGAKRRNGAGAEQRTARGARAASTSAVAGGRTARGSGQRMARAPERERQAANGARARGADSERRSGACNEHERGGRAANGAGERAGKVYERGGESGQPEPKKKKQFLFAIWYIWRKGASVAAMLQRREPIEAKSLRG
ncbi:hypothetical protein B0H14DRAFT_3574181 [Mycena olivaceomarginata]|nr:hypothetical protein B0H14DRAFT_3574181 [Mycena olivaceomarginata]